MKTVQDVVDHIYMVIEREEKEIECMFARIGRTIKAGKDPYDVFNVCTIIRDITT